ncbi:MAG: phosphoribosyltransferase [Scytonematopsis contorta HA4267-MV1]|jgi:predicted phosphoribosyltransferase|nr:phosphoribosyltransferase [Scytonematopsis contorta HA4267-MV1]
MTNEAPFFLNRTHAGEELAQKIQAILTEQASTSEVQPVPIVYALPRGGIPVAAPIAKLLGCPLTILTAKKIGHPLNPELAIGAVSASGNILWSSQNNFQPNFNHKSRQRALDRALQGAKSLDALLNPACPQVNPQGATVIIVDDGIATGMTIAVAVNALLELSPAQIWLCSPVAPLKLVPWLQQLSDCLIILETPETFLSVSNFYVQFPQVNTEEALRILGSGE